MAAALTQAAGAGGLGRRTAALRCGATGWPALGGTIVLAWIVIAADLALHRALPAATRSM